MSLGDADEQAPGEVVDGLAGRRRRIVVQRVHREVGGTLIDVVEDQRLAGVVVVHRGFVQTDGVGDVVHPGAVIAPGGEQLGSDGQQFLTTGHPVGRCGDSPRSWGPTRLRGTACAKSSGASGDEAGMATHYMQAQGAPGRQSTGWQFKCSGCCGGGGGSTLAPEPAATREVMTWIRTRIMTRATSWNTASTGGPGFCGASIRRPPIPRFKPLSFSARRRTIARADAHKRDCASSFR